MVKFRLYVNKDRETNWLNEMVRRGYAMEGFFAGFYLFGACSPGEFIYQIDITEGFFRIPSDYREFMGEAGVEIMGLWGPWVFLRKRAAEGPFELYTDVESTIEHYTRIRNLFKVATAVEIACLVMEFLAVLRGVSWAGVFACVIGAIVVAFIREVVRLNEILAELKGRLGEEGSFGRQRRPSRFLAAGMLANAVAFMIDNPAGQFQKHCLVLLAVFLVGVGVVRTWIKRE
ncbi:MAG: DUF2812 domain-containing protein [Acetatifactor sp.]|nr:DUF2812 domain-containing protein [Acetatifactor sp.]